MARGKLKRMNTTMKFDNSRDAIKRYDALNVHSDIEDEEDEDGR